MVASGSTSRSPLPSGAGEDGGLCLIHEAARVLQCVEQCLTTATLGGDFGATGKIDQLAAVAQRLGGPEHVLGQARGGVRRLHAGLWGGFAALRGTAGGPPPLRGGRVLHGGDDWAGVGSAVLREVLLVLCLCLL